MSDSVLHLARMRSQLGSEEGAAGVLTDCLGGITRADARPLAHEWLAAAERASLGEDASRGDRRALDLLGQALQVPMTYFVDRTMAETVDAWLLRHNRDDAPARFHGPCRPADLTVDLLAAVHTHLLRELATRVDPLQGEEGSSPGP
ncbi:hypothetical protein [Pseudonocardia ammonioxydans]|nr:hypothetical protein [Pseudonocardia ammonioxydans]